MKLVVFSHKPCWPSADSPSGFATDGGFPFQMRALSELFDQTTLVVPCGEATSCTGQVALDGNNLTVTPLTSVWGKGLARKLVFGLWLLRNMPVIVREIVKADAVHTPIPGDVGTIGMVLALLLRKRLFVRHCGNWLRPATKAEHFWKWSIEKFAGGRNVMLATGGSPEPPSKKNSQVEWIFSTSLSESELSSAQPRELSNARSAKLIIVCRQDRKKGTGTVIESLPLIQKAFPEITLDVVGDGGSLIDFQELATRLGVGDKVTFHGKVNHEGVLALLQQADLFCYPTQASEGFPKVVLEALASGLPVLTTRVSVLPQLLSPGGGLLLDEATPEALAAATVLALSEGQSYQQMSQRAIETARQFSLERWRDSIGSHLHAAWGSLSKRDRNASVTVDPTTLKVCFVVGTLGRGGAERQLIYMLNVLKDVGAKVRILCLTRGEALEPEIKALGIPLTWVGQSRWRPLRLLRIVQELRREPADVVQSSHFYTNLYAAAAARILRIKSVGAIRNDLTSEMRSNRWLGFAQVRLPHRLIANTKLAQQRALIKSIRNIDVLRNAVAVNGFRKERSDDDQLIRILCAGRLTKQKRVDRFLHALGKLAVARADLKFRATIAGDGPFRGELETLADSLQLRPRHVEFLGEVADLKPLFLESDMLVLTSDWEGCPNVLLEAMACGLPVVATCVGGVPEIVLHEENGFLVQPENIDAIISSISALADSRELRTTMGLSGRLSVSKRHSMSQLSDGLLRIYARTLSADVVPNSSIHHQITMRAQAAAAASRELV